MKKSLFIVSILLLFSTVADAQLSFKERRQMSRAYNAGLENIYSQNYIAAITDFTKCLDFDENYAIAYMQRGRVKAELGQMEEALQDLDMAISKDRELGEAYFYKGYLLSATDTSGVSMEHLLLALGKRI